MEDADWADVDPRRRLSEAVAVATCDCPPCVDLSGVSLGTPEVLENVDADVALTMPAASTSNWVKFVALSSPCCTGAASAGPTEGGKLSEAGSVQVNMPAGYYKACVALDMVAPMGDDDYSLFETALLYVTVTRPPPPPPPPSLPPPSPPPPSTPPSLLSPLPSLSPPPSHSPPPSVSPRSSAGR